MNVGDLKKLLNEHADEMEVVVDVHSDYRLVGGLSVIRAVPQAGGWVMRSHSTMSAENKASEKNYLHVDAE